VKLLGRERNSGKERGGIFPQPDTEEEIGMEPEGEGVEGKRKRKEKSKSQTNIHCKH
jgi:hypothetical protein